MKISEIIELSTAFSAEVNVERDFEYPLVAHDKYIDGYLPNRSSRAIIKSIFETLSSRAVDKLHLITASYGTGKSYLLLMLAYLLAEKDISKFQEFEKKLLDKDAVYNDGVTDALKQYWTAQSQYLVVIPEYGTDDFEQGMLAALNRALALNGIDFTPTTNYLRAAQTLEDWQRDNQFLFGKLQELVPNKNGADFIRLLRDCDGATYLRFKELYKQLVFAPFSENHGDIYTAFQETAHHLTALDYKGIVTIYDEFGTMLQTLINRSELASTGKIQQFIEFVKDKKDGTANLLFIAASHSDPNNLNENKAEQDTVKKLIGRFKIHRMQIEENESEELMAQVFRKKDPIKKDMILSPEVLGSLLEEVRSIAIYSDKDDQWVTDQIIKNLYPLHPLTAYILPLLSNQFAQNNRTMFNFLSPNESETGSLKRFLTSTDAERYETGMPNLLTPDLLLDYFRPNLLASSAVSMDVDAYDGAMGKEDDEEIGKLFRNILMLKVSRRKVVTPNFELLYIANQAAERGGFKNLLDDLVTDDKLELNPTTKAYELPQVGSRNFGKVFEDEKRKLAGLSIYECRTIWESVQPIEDYRFLTHQAKFGANRAYKSICVFTAKELEGFLDELPKIYSGELKDQNYQGYQVFLLIRDEALLEAFQRIISGPYKEIAKYVVFAKPRDPALFGNLMTNSIAFQAFVNTEQNVEIKSNVNHADKARNSVVKARSDLSNTVNQTFSPANWLWSFDDLSAWREINNPRTLETNMDSYIETLFTDVLNVKDDALWFGKSSTTNIKARHTAISMILTAPKNTIPTYNGNTFSHEMRILTNFFVAKIIVRDTSSGPNIQYGEITIPKPGTTWLQIWQVIDKTLIIGKVVSPAEFIQPLLKAPYGLSEPIIKLVFTCYVRYYADILIFTEPRNTFANLDKSAVQIDEMFKKPASFGVRKIDLSDFARRYIKAMHMMFSNEASINSFEQVAKRFETSHFLTKLQFALIDEEPEIKKYYRTYLLPFIEAFKTDRTDKEQESKEYFMDILPKLFFPGITVEEFENDNENIKTIVGKLKQYKEYPFTKESDYKLEVLGHVSTQLFGKVISTPQEFKQTVKTWYNQLSPNTKNVAKFENDKINTWLRCLRFDEAGDITKFYLEELSIKPVKDWTDIHNDRAIFINELRNYKEEIERYKKSPIEVYQFVARDCFGLASKECPSEQIFIDLINNWWHNLPLLNREAVFEDESVNIFLSEFKSSATILQKVLVNIPTKWKDAGFLAIMANEWEDWTQDEVRRVAARYALVFKAVTEWQAPIPEEIFVEEIAEIFGITGAREFEQLETPLKSQWYDQLGYNTKIASWTDGSDNKQFTDAIKSGHLRSYFIKTLPEKLAMPDFKFWNKDILTHYLKHVNSIRLAIETYRRPLMQLIAELEKRLKTNSITVTEFRAAIKEQIAATEAYINKAEQQADFLDSKPAIIFLAGIRSLNSDNAFKLLVHELAIEFGITDTYDQWLPDIQTTFVKEFTRIFKYLQDWKFPEDQLLVIAKEKIGVEIKSLQHDLRLSNAQLIKVLRDLIDENQKDKK